MVCPSVVRLWTAEGREVLRRFAELRGYDYCDVAGVNLHQRQTSDPPETGAPLPIVLQAVGGPPTRAAPAVEELQRWLSGTSTRWCGHGSAINLSDNMWQCEFTAQDRRLLVVRWTPTGTAVTTAAPDSEELRRLDGTSHPLHSGDPIPVSETPVLILHRSP